VRWPAKAVDALAYLFRPLQDIDVYVEDEGSEAFYADFLGRIAPSGLQIERVFALGGARAVREKAESHDFSHRRALFLIDGDLAWVRGDALPQVRGLYRLEGYCIENMLICPHAIAQILMENEACDEACAVAMLSFGQWASTVDCLIELFICWAAMNAIDPTVKTVAHGIGAVLDGNCKPPSIDTGKVEALRKEAESVVVAVPGGTLLLDDIRQRVQAMQFPLDCVSGKDFLLPALQIHLSSLSRARMRRHALEFRLSRHVAHERTAELGKALERAARALPV